MIRNLKALGLALVAVFAVSAVVASAASAQTLGVITTESGLAGTSVTLTGTQNETAPEGTLKNSFTVEFLGHHVLHCPGSTYTGHKITTTPHEPIPNGASEITVSPHYVNCVDETGAHLTVDMNGCDYHFKDATTTPLNTGTYGVNVGITCPVGKEIEITGGACLIRIPAQTDLTGFHLTNTPASDDIDLTGSANVRSFVCGFERTAVQRVDVTIKGHDSLGKATGVTITD